eukprot:CAMPEP_0195538330 /NCGR_PEP_ID=MMETSP0794_2-20130614/49470_1 /TAXON_ID=515487 /ORGANISM="Stephanopyxis turris, Strain CCMP 815" /LENGTH=463 /DNA_ID=CAMNT_0040672301 /DNA_START=42 /DNA_END=1433 /DNA_ORIENTATION=-
MSAAVIDSLAELQLRRSAALADVRISTLDDVGEVGSTDMKPVRILVTIHEIESGYSNLIKNGLGLWVFYILHKYFRHRGIPCVLFLKSITFGERSQTKLDEMVRFIKRNKIDMLIPSDVTDTMFLSKHAAFFNPLVKMAVTNDLHIYETLEDKWDTYNFCLKGNIPTPKTEKLEDWEKAKSFPFFLKISSGTNGGRGVWFIKSQEQLDATIAEDGMKETLEEKNAILLAQQPTLGRIICSEVIYKHGVPRGFFFAESVQADDLAGVGNKYIKSSEKSEGHSHIKVELSDEQWEAVTEIFVNVGKATGYHGMIDIEFIVADKGNANAKEGSIWLLECNPRFSGDIHTTLSNPGFLDLYFDLINDRIDDDAPVINFSRGVDMKANFSQWNPTNFFVQNPKQVVHVRNWSKDATTAVVKGKKLQWIESGKSKEDTGDRELPRRKSVMLGSNRLPKSTAMAKMLELG